MREKNTTQNQRIAILGGGITGLTAAYDIAKKGHTVTLFEKAPVLGGLAVGFKGEGWKWPLERAYHHLFANDTDILNFAKEIGFDGIFFQSPHTDSLYFHQNKFISIPVDTPLDFLKFPLLPVVDKIRGAFWLAILKFLPFFSSYENTTAEVFVKHKMGDRMWDVFFKELFRKKYGKYAGNILASFLWARIHKRTKQLGYVKEGFQTLINHIEKKDKEMGVVIKKGFEIETLTEKDGVFTINGDSYDMVISTLPSIILAKVASQILPPGYIANLMSLNYLHARVLILETDVPLLEETYWLNICTDKVPLMLVAQHTNFVDKKNYGGNHIAYVGYYLEKDDPLMGLSAEDFEKEVVENLKIFIRHDFTIRASHDFVGPFAQPIFDRDFIENKPDFETPIPNFYIANLDMTYPYDRGTNYAVKLGREVALLV